MQQSGGVRKIIKSFNKLAVHRNNSTKLSSFRPNAISTRSLSSSPLVLEEKKESKPATPKLPSYVIGVPKETYLNEKRIAQTPETVKQLIKEGHKVIVEQGAGVAAKFLDADFTNAGAEIKNSKDVFLGSDILVKVRGPKKEEVEMMKEGQTLVSFVWPAVNKPLVEQLAQKKATVFGMDCVPRISRAQVFDALSSMSNIAGYKV